MKSIIKDIYSSKTHDHPVLGIALALLAYFFLNFMNILSKYVSDDYHFVELAFWRFVFAFIPIGLWVLLTRNKEIAIAKNYKFIMLRAFFGTSGLICTFATLSYLPLTISTAIFFTHVFIVPILAILFLNEWPGIWRISAICIGFTGAYLIVNPTANDTLPIIGLFFGTMTTFIYAFLAIIVRKAGQYDSPQTITFYFMGFGVIVTGLYILISNDLSMIIHTGMPYLIGMGLSGLVGQLCITAALRVAHSSSVTLCYFTGLIWALLFGWLIWDEIPTTIMFIGMTLIISANLLTSWRERVNQKKAL